MSNINTVTIEQQLHQQSKTLLEGQEHYYRVFQAKASPYSHKLMTYMNHKGIPYKKIWASMLELEWVKKVAGQSIVPIMLSPNDDIMQDSTPIIEYLEEKYPAVSTIPEDNKLAFIMWLIEDFGDEYLPRLQMHTRWGNEQNRHTLSHRIAREILRAIPNMQVKDLAPVILNRQTGFDKNLGLVGEESRHNLDQQVLNLLAILEQHFQDYQFVLGFKPSIADFALYGPIKVHFYEDPQSNEIMETQAPRTCNWLQTIKDLGDIRGCAGQTEFGDWLDLSQGLPDSLEKLLNFIAKTYIPLCKATAKASIKKEKTFNATIYGVSSTFTTHHYRAWAFEQLQLRYQTLNDDDKSALSPILTSTEILPELINDGIIHIDLFDDFTPPFIKDGIPDARIRYIKSKKK